METGKRLAVVSLCSSILVIGFVSAREAVEEPGRIIGFEERVAAQRAIEEVFWRHRIWPKENPDPKPSLSEVMSATDLRTKVEEALLESTALEAQWQQPITTAELQAEMERMAQQTRDPGVLRELFDALDNDPALIAETLVRSSLADRRLRALQSRDERIQGAIRRQAERTLAPGTLDPLQLEAHGGVYNERTARDDEKDEILARVAARFATSQEQTPLQRWSALEEDEESFFALAVLEITKESVTTATVRWRKEPFEAWWAQQREAMAQAPLPRSGPFHAVSVSTQAPCEPGTWSSLPGGLAQFAPAIRTSHSAVWTGAEMIIWGGSNWQGTSLNSGGRYNPVTDSWTPTSMGANVPAPRTSARVVWTGTQMIVFGGTSATAGGRYDPAADIWVPMATAGAPAEATFQTVIWAGTRMIVWGGDATNTGGRYDPVTNTWSPTSTGANVPVGRSQHTAVWTGSEMIIWGGHSMGSSYLTTGGRYDPVTNAWRTMAPVGPGRAAHTAIWTGSSMIVWSGHTLSGLAWNGVRYNPDTDSWTAIATTGAPSYRTHYSIVWAGQSMIVWGGREVSPVFLNSGGRYFPGSDTWLPTSTGSGVPSPRFRNTLVWTGTEVIVWGGDRLSALAADGGSRYDPSTDTWARVADATPPTGVPIPRYRHTAVWTGSEMIVWGGQSEASALDSGGRYRPATDDWLATSIGPGVHAGHVAVWSGTEMLAVWGGGGLQPTIEDGSRYDPATNTWNAFGPHALVNRQDASGVWTGSEVLVWGGVDNGLCARADGGRYRPADGTSATIFSFSAPAARSRHAGVWSGSEFLAWGGIVRPGGCSGAVTATSDGGRYSPATGTWTATAPRQAGTTSTLGVWTGEEMIAWIPRTRTCERYDLASNTWSASCTSPSTPSSRDGASLVWTGGTAIAWGGADAASSQIRNDGGIFDPASGAWLSLASGIPAGRSQHSAVWTGFQMFVWGGFESPTTLSSSGAAYCGCPNESSPYVDADQDGWGGPLRAAVCDGSMPPGTSALSGDCNDSDPVIRPDGVETCNGVDEDCDGAVDDVSASECADGVDCTNDFCQFGACAHDALDSRCLDAVACTVDRCNPGTGCTHTPDAARCDDDLVCTLDTCDPTNGCGHAPNDALCDDGIACTANTCNPTDGCLYPPNDSYCEDGNPCSRDWCAPSVGCVYEPSGACDHDPRDLGYWRAVCASQVPGVALRPADVACVSATCAFDEVGSVAQACARLRPVSVGDGCQQADAQLMAALLNRCVGRVSETFPIESTCDDIGTSTIQQSIEDADTILCLFRQQDYCAHARCLTAEIADGGALHTSSLRLSRDPGGTRLDWSPPFAPDLGPPTSYDVWRRVGAAGAFEPAHTTSDAFWVDAGDEPRVDYEVRYRWSPQ